MRLKILWIVPLFILIFVQPLHSARRSTCSDNTDPCYGSPIWWPSLVDLRYTVDIDSSGTNGYPGLGLDCAGADSTKCDPTLDTLAEFEDAVDSSFAVWQETGLVSFIKSRTDYDGTSEATFASDSFWSPSQINVVTNITSSSMSAGTIALTVVLHSGSTGQIFGSNILINNDNNNFDYGSSTSHYNLQAILVHEIGHFLGIAHPCTLPSSSEDWEECTVGSPYASATMYPSATPSGELGLITLANDDFTALMLACSDGNTTCLNFNYGEKVSVEQGSLGGCFGVKIDKDGDSGYLIIFTLVMLFLPFLMILFLKKSEG
jgi:hypothetical protein